MTKVTIVETECTTLVYTMSTESRPSRVLMQNPCRRQKRQRGVGVVTTRGLVIPQTTPVPRSYRERNVEPVWKQGPSGTNQYGFKVSVVVYVRNVESGLRTPEVSTRDQTNPTTRFLTRNDIDESRVPYTPYDVSDIRISVMVG